MSTTWHSIIINVYVHEWKYGPACICLENIVPEMRQEVFYFDSQNTQEAHKEGPKPLITWYVSGRTKAFIT